MADERRDLPPANSPNFLEKVREVLSTYLGKRGDTLDRGVTLRDLVDVDLVTLRPGYKPGSSKPIGGIGGGVGGGGAYEPDLTPPPTPTGCTVTPTFASLILEHDTPVYTLGHGHARTRVYGATYTSALPVFADAVQITEFTGTVFAHATTLGTKWRLWFTWVTVDGIESAVPAGGTNGIDAVTGKVGNSDLGSLIVEAANLANGSVTATKVAANAIDLTKFANGIEPVTIVTGAMPTTKITNTIYWTTDGKVYRWVGSSYSKATDGADITANSITAGQIQAGAVGADQIAANAITTGKLLVTGQGASAWLDPNFADPSAWQVAPWHGFPVQGTVTDGVSGGTTLRSPTGSGASAFGARRVPVVVGRRYRCSVRARRSADANGTFYFRLDADTTATGGYSQIVASVEGSTPGTSWTYYSFEWVATYPWVSPMVLVNYTGTAGWMEAQAIRIEEKADADLIVDGSIIASKIAANAIAVGSAAIQDGAIRNALIGDLAVDNAKIASMSVAKLLAGSLAVGQYIRSTSYVPGSSGWTINADGTAELGAAYIRGQLVASQIDTRNLTIKDGSGNVLFGAGTNLAASYITPAAGWLNSNIGVSGGVLTGIGTSGVQVDNSYAVIGQNLIPNSDQSAAMTYGQGVNVGHSTLLSLSWASTHWVDTYTLVGGTTRNLTYAQNGPAAGGDNYPVIDFYPTGGWSQATAIPIVGGQRYCLSGYLQAHRCYLGAALQFFNLDGSAASDLIETGAVPTSEGRADHLSAYQRVHIMAVAPAGAVTCRVAFRKYNTRSGEGNSYFWMAAPQFEAVAANATAPSPYMPGPAGSTRQLGYVGDLDATLGASWGGNLSGRPSNLAGLSGSEAIKNGDITISISAGGALSASGGPSVSGGVTLSGLGAGEMATINQITSANKSTYISGAIIDLANINVASIGTLGALSSYLGTVEIATGGYLRSGQTAWSTGSGFWLGWIGSGPGEPGISIGTSTAYLRYRPSTGLEIKFDSMTATAGAATYSNVSNGGPRDYGYCAVSVSGGTAPYSYSWSLISATYDNGSVSDAPASVYMSSSGTDQAYFRGIGSNAYVSVYAECLVTDSNGRSVRAPVSFTVLHGTYSPA